MWTFWLPQKKDFTSCYLHRRTIERQVEVVGEFSIWYIAFSALLGKCIIAFIIWSFLFATYLRNFKMLRIEFAACTIWNYLKFMVTRCGAFGFRCTMQCLLVHNTSLFLHLHTSCSWSQQHSMWFNFLFFALSDHCNVPYNMNMAQTCPQSSNWLPGYHSLEHQMPR